MGFYDPKNLTHSAILVQHASKSCPREYNSTCAHTHTRMKLYVFINVYINVRYAPMLCSQRSFYDKIIHRFCLKYEKTPKPNRNWIVYKIQFFWNVCTMGNIDRCVYVEYIIARTEISNESYMGSTRVGDCIYIHNDPKWSSSIEFYNL